MTMNGSAEKSSWFLSTATMSACRVTDRPERTERTVGLVVDRRLVAQALEVGTASALAIEKGC